MSMVPGPDDQVGGTHMSSPTPARRDPLVSRSPADLLVPGVVVEVTPEEARAMGAFEETALSEDDAWEANADVGAETAGDRDDGTAGIAHGGSGPRG